AVATREDDREPAGAMEGRSIGPRPARVPGRRHPRAVAQHRAARGLGRNRELLDGGPDVAPLRLNDVVDAFDHLRPCAERQHLGRTHRTAGGEVCGAHRRFPVAQPGPDRLEVVAVERVRDLDEIPVGVAHVDRLDGAERARLLHRAFLDGHAERAQMADPLAEWSVAEEAQVAGAGRRPRRVGLVLLADLVEVDLLLAERERRPPGAEGHDLHAERPRVEVAGGPDVLNRQHEVIEPREHHVKMLSGRNADTIQLGASTISLILRSTATLQSAYACSRLSPRSDTRWSIM